MAAICLQNPLGAVLLYKHTLYESCVIEDRGGLLFFRDLGGRFRAYLGSRNVFGAQAKCRFLRLTFVIFEKMVFTTDLEQQKFDIKQIFPDTGA